MLSTTRLRDLAFNIFSVLTFCLSLDWTPCHFTSSLTMKRLTLRKGKREETKKLGKLLKMECKQERANVAPTRDQKGMQDFKHNKGNIVSVLMLKNLSCIRSLH